MHIINKENILKCNNIFVLSLQLKLFSHELVNHFNSYRFHLFELHIIALD